MFIMRKYQKGELYQAGQEEKFIRSQKKLHDTWQRCIADIISSFCA